MKQPNALQSRSASPPLGRPRPEDPLACPQDPPTAPNRRPQLTATLETWDIFGPKGPSTTVDITVYKALRLVPSDKKATCIAVRRT